MNGNRWQVILYLATMLASGAAAAFSAMTRAAVAETKAELIAMMHDIERRTQDHYVTREELRSLMQGRMR
ncbi:MAG: hypothetical protein NZ765_09640 [Anaerolineae bacterium]|nr:hypothetical protein [Anaerolineae bacterium]MDW8071875.1 hypothetical protein [Anaerolineae bacterium]